MLARITGAAMRAILIAILIATPALLLPSLQSRAPEMIVLVALLASALTFIEYHTSYPSIVEFRDAPPINRIRFIALFAIVFFLTVILKHQYSPSNLTTLMAALGTMIGNLVDFPYSPVRLIVLMLPDDAPLEVFASVRTAAGVSYLISVLAVLSFLGIVRFMGWPTGTGSFNVWVNLPLFDPTAGGDVVQRLYRDSRINIVLGFLLPFIIPALVKGASDLIDPTTLTYPHTLIWTMSAWAFLPASLVMRGIAMARIGDLIEEKRRRSFSEADAFQTA